MVPQLVPPWYRSWSYSWNSTGVRFLALGSALAGLGGAASGVQRVCSEALLQGRASLLSNSPPTANPQVDIM